MQTAGLKVLAALTIVGAGLLAAAPLGAQQPPRPPGWDDATHGAAADPDYARLFAMDRVHEIHIRIAAEDYLAMQQDLATIGRGGVLRAGAAAGPGQAVEALISSIGGFVGSASERFEAAAAACAGLEPGASCALDGVEGSCRPGPAATAICLPVAAVELPPSMNVVFSQAPAARGGFTPGATGPAGRGGTAFGAIAPVLTTRDPIYVPVTVSHDGRRWTAVGMRYKGNSSLSAASMGRSGKVPFRLDFDRYEDEEPGTHNQRFYGFDKLTFSSNYADDSMLREVLATEAFRDQGVPAAHAAFYRVFVDTGNGDEYWGLYTMIEDPADGAMLDAQFGDDDGNLYKPNGPGANWSGFDPAGFDKKTNERAADFSDVESAIAALHAPQSDPAAWRAGLEAQFDVEGFLRWLAVNSLIGNWDAYGRMAHNYYLYGDPGDGGRLHWIPWDHNMSFAAVAGGRSAGPFGPGGDMLHRAAGDGWPLISRLMQDPVYAARYRELLALALDGLTEPARFEARVSELHALIAPHVVGELGETPSRTTLSSRQAFENSPAALIRRSGALRDQARAALAEAD